MSEVNNCPICSGECRGHTGEEVELITSLRQSLQLASNLSTNEHDRYSKCVIQIMKALEYINANF